MSWTVSQRGRSLVSGRRKIIIPPKIPHRPRQTFVTHHPYDFYGNKKNFVILSFSGFQLMFGNIKTIYYLVIRLKAMFGKIEINTDVFTEIT